MRFFASFVRKPLVKPFHEIPAPKLSDRLIDSSHLHEHCTRLHKELGVIYRDFLGPTEMVFIADSTLVQTVLSNEGVYPRQNVPVSWSRYNQMRNIQRGLFFQTGPDWKRIREVSNRVLLKDTVGVNRFSESLIGVNSDLFKQWDSKLQDSSSFREVDALKFDLCKWSIEATSLMLFKRRLGCLSSDLSSLESERASSLVRNVAKMFDETTRLHLIPLEKYETDGSEVWHQFKATTDIVLDIANSLTVENIEKFKKDPQCDGLLKGFIDSGTLSESEISRTMVDFIVAAADTTSSSLQWMLYLVSRHPAVGEKLYNEVNQVLNSSCRPDDYKDNLPYLRAFMKEASRFYPTAPFLARTIDKNIVLGNFEVPANTPIVLSLYTTSRSPNYFIEPDDFKPERWLRLESVAGGCPMRKTGYSLASLPFGIGARNCVGRRLAELQMCLFLMSFVERYYVQPTDKNMGIKLNMILCPSSPIRLKLKRRR